MLVAGQGILYYNFLILSSPLPLFSRCVHMYIYVAEITNNSIGIIFVGHQSALIQLGDCLSVGTFGLVFSSGSPRCDDPLMAILLSLLLGRCRLGIHMEIKLFAYKLINDCLSFSKSGTPLAGHHHQLTSQIKSNGMTPELSNHLPSRIPNYVVSLEHLLTFDLVQLSGTL